MLQKQREDLDRVTEENKVLKSRYENAIEVNMQEILISNLPCVSMYMCMHFFIVSYPV